MLESYLKRKDVSSFIKLIKNNPKYHRKKIIEKNNLGRYSDSEHALYVFYDALFKYKIIIDDIHLFDFYFRQIRKIYKKIDNIDDITYGIHKALCSTLGRYLDIYDVELKENREEIIKHIYKRYIINGYYVHGFCTVYEKSIRNNGFNTESYENYYSDMKKIQEIFDRHNIKDIMNKDFDNKSISFTDNFTMGCYYSVYAPGYFYNLLFNDDVYDTKESNKTNYLIRNYKKSIRYLRKKIEKFTSVESKFIIENVKKEWDYINSVPKKISLLVVKRKTIKDSTLNLEDILNKSGSIYEIVDGMLSSKNGRVSYRGFLDALDVDVVSLEDFYDVVSEGKSVKEKGLLKVGDKLNAYGVISTFIVIGSMAISLGVIVTILKFLGGI